MIEELHPPIIDLKSAKWISDHEYELRHDAKRFENWEFNYAAVLGLGVAVDYALEIGLENIRQRNNELADYLRDRLTEIKNVVPHTISKNQCAIVTFWVKNHEATDIVNALRKHHINASVSEPGSTLLDATKNHLPSLVRASLHYYNDEVEIDKFIEILKKIIIS